MKLHRMMAGVYAANCYIISDEKNEAVIIDPGGDFDDIEKYLEENHLHPVYILLTHGHGDHIGAVEELKEKYDAAIVISDKEEKLLGNSQINLSQAMPGKSVEIHADILLKKGDTITFSGKEISFIETPGHTEGSVVYRLDNWVFTGDTLFRQSIGRTDLPTGDSQKMKNSLEWLINHLKPEDRIFPGHGAETNLKFELENNPYLNG